MLRKRSQQIPVSNNNKCLKTDIEPMETTYLKKHEVYLKKKKYYLIKTR